MITITFPDGSKKQFAKGVTGLEIAKSISDGLARVALAIEVNGKQWDLNRAIDENATIKIFTPKDANGVDILRHSCAHVLAEAIMELYPYAKLTIGPVVEHGFYYDIDHAPFTPADLEKIEQRMQEIIKRDLPIQRIEISKKKALDLFKDNEYKVELINEMKDGEITVYEQGKFMDLCRGPHIPSTGKIKAFKLTKLAGAYWRGDEKNKQLQRIYGVCFATKDELNTHLTMVEEARKRDHRKLGKELDLFTFSDLVGSGLPLWTPKGSVIRRALEQFIVKEELARGYLHVYTPELAKVDLFKKSGHYPYYKESMYPLMKIEEEEFILRPMTCPHHFQLFLDKPRSYRELPMRIAELAKLFRYEKSGELTGLIRVRSFCLADAHIVCRKTQAFDEVNRALDLIEYVCEILGIEKGSEYRYRLSLGDRNDDKKYYKNDQLWDEAEDLLRKVVKGRDVPFYEAEKEAAFYGPKIDIQMKNVNGKEDTAFTVQYDFCMPDRFDLTFTNENNEQEKALVVHRSSIGAIERIMGFLIEKYAGKFPLWLSPVQVKIIPVASTFNDYVDQVAKKLQEEDLRVEVDLSPETLNKKIRNAQLEQVNYILVVGEKEMNEESVNVRTRDNQVHGMIKVIDFVAKLKHEVKEKVK